MRKLRELEKYANHCLQTNSRKEKRKLAQKIMIQELSLMEEELKEMKTVDNTLSKIRHDYKNLIS